jgi:hypothetical protein
LRARIPISFSTIASTIPTFVWRTTFISAFVVSSFAKPALAIPTFILTGTVATILIRTISAILLGTVSAAPTAIFVSPPPAAIVLICHACTPRL